MKVNVVEKLSDTELKVQNQCRGYGAIFSIFLRGSLIQHVQAYIMDLECQTQ